MKALTICQPYASAIMCGIKRVENRDWPTSYRGPLVIHAGKSRQWLDSYDGRQEAEMRAAGFRFNEDGELRITKPEYFGSILCVVDLADCLKIEDYRKLPGCAEDAWAFGEWCWVLQNPRRTRVTPYRGQQGLFNIPDDAVILADQVSAP